MCSYLYHKCWLCDPYKLWKWNCYSVTENSSAPFGLFPTPQLTAVKLAVYYRSVLISSRWKSGAHFQCCLASCWWWTRLTDVAYIRSCTKDPPCWTTSDTRFCTRFVNNRFCQWLSKLFIVLDLILLKHFYWYWMVLMFVTE